MKHEEALGMICGGWIRFKGSSCRDVIIGLGLKVEGQSVRPGNPGVEDQPRRTGADDIKEGLRGVR